jgi:hypothetical protein
MKMAIEHGRRATMAPGTGFPACAAHEIRYKIHFGRIIGGPRTKLFPEKYS